MAQGRRYIAVLTIFLLLWAQDAFARPVFLQVEGGDTAFIVDSEAEEAFWVLDDCKRPLPMKSKTGTVLTSETLSDTVQLGSNEVELRQRFRFDMNLPVSVEIYNSVRGGWSPVPVQVEETCHQSAECRARMELSPCSGG